MPQQQLTEKEINQYISQITMVSSYKHGLDGNTGFTLRVPLLAANPRHIDDRTDSVMSEFAIRVARRLDLGSSPLMWGFNSDNPGTINIRPPENVDETRLRSAIQAEIDWASARLAAQEVSNRKIREAATGSSAVHCVPARKDCPSPSRN